jgi:hypothetical protein
MRVTRAGFTAAARMVLAGAWVFFAPFIVGYQPRGGHWVTATHNDLATGGAIAAASLTGLITTAALTVRDLRRRAHTARPPAGPHRLEGADRASPVLEPIPIAGGLLLPAAERSWRSGCGAQTPARPGCGHRSQQQNPCSNPEET